MNIPSRILHNAINRSGPPDTEVMTHIFKTTKITDLKITFTVIEAIVESKESDLLQLIYDSPETCKTFDPSMAGNMLIRTAVGNLDVKSATVLLSDQRVNPAVGSQHALNELVTVGRKRFTNPNFEKMLALLLKDPRVKMTKKILDKAITNGNVDLFKRLINTDCPDLMHPVLTTLSIATTNIKKEMLNVMLERVDFANYSKVAWQELVMTALGSSVSNAVKLVLMCPVDYVTLTLLSQVMILVLNCNSVNCGDLLRKLVDHPWNVKSKDLNTAIRHTFYNTVIDNIPRPILHKLMNIGWVNMIDLIDGGTVVSVIGLLYSKYNNLTQNQIDRYMLTFNDKPYNVAQAFRHLHTVSFKKTPFTKKHVNYIFNCMTQLSDRPTSSHLKGSSISKAYSRILHQLSLSEMCYKHSNIWGVRHVLNDAKIYKQDIIEGFDLIHTKGPLYKDLVSSVCRMLTGMHLEVYRRFPLSL